MNWPYLYDDVLKTVPSAYYISKKWKINQTLVYRAFDELINKEIIGRIFAVPGYQKNVRDIACLFSNSRPDKSVIKKLLYNFNAEKIYSGYIDDAYGEFLEFAKLRWIVLIEYFKHDENLRNLIKKYEENFQDIRFYCNHNKNNYERGETLNTSVFYKDLIPIFKRNAKYDRKEISKLRSEIKKIMRKNEYYEFLPLIKFNLIRNRIIKGFLIKQDGEGQEFKKFIRSENILNEHIIFYRESGNLKLAIFQYETMMDEEKCDSIIIRAFPNYIKLWNIEMDVKNQL